MVFFIDEQYLGLVGDNMSLEKKIKEKDKRIEKLEELLKECRDEIKFMYDTYGKSFPKPFDNSLITKIDEALK